ncbi:MAG: hypothetical protein R3F37_03050 [Candidatus Competibacteraceae bacterium]
MPRQEPDLQEPLQMTVLLTVLAGREGVFRGTEEDLDDGAEKWV